MYSPQEHFVCPIFHFFFDTLQILFEGDDVLDKEMKVQIPEKLNERIKKQCRLHTSHVDELQALLQELIAQSLEQAYGKDHPQKEVLTIPTSSFKSNSRFVQLVCVVNTSKIRSLAEKLVQETFRYCKGILFNTSKFEQEVNVKKQCQALLRVARKLFGRLGNVNELLREIMTEAKGLTNAER